MIATLNTWKLTQQNNIISGSNKKNKNLYGLQKFNVKNPHTLSNKSNVFKKTRK